MLPFPAISPSIHYSIHPKLDPQAHLFPRKTESCQWGLDGQGALGRLQAASGKVSIHIDPVRHPSIHPIPSHPIPSHPIPSMRSLPSRGCREEEDIKNSFRLGCVPLVRPSTSKTRPACHRRERETAPIEQVNKRRCKSRSTLCHAWFLRAGHGDIHNIIIVINSTSGTRSMLVTAAAAAAAIAPD